ncbi:pilus assembly protein PilP [Nitrosomonas marina]|uniref:Type IV pilus assembly protein PilP n=1 Tax=Nitrosomonas marina TaxID=917 RepID=A0A1H8ECP0_9PROT|nr:pilus assembly protein PilP [Nitrosomonas marina]SEN17289.1 type IV pilus assembly protein PilP [Nitrosomonas marina]
MKKLRIMVILVAASLLTACESGDLADLDTFISNAGKGLRGQVDPLPEVKTFELFAYDAFDIPSPFEPRKKEQAQSAGNGIQPDLTRRKEYLESFPLESLEMVGSLEQNGIIYAVVKTPEKSLLRVGIGNYLGQDFGKINQISESEIELRELVQDGVNEWSERISTLMLKN